MTAMKSMLLAIDLNQESSWKITFPHAIALSRLYETKLHAITVIPDFGMPIVGAHFPPDYSEKAVSEARRALQALLEKELPGDIASEAHATQGTIYKEIIAAADRVNAEMILIASHRPEMQDYLIGPNAARVVRHARQSVTVLR